MSENLKLLCVLAHPDDETLGLGGLLAKCADEGIETYLISATRGERGWRGDPEAFPGLKAFGQVREKELRAAGEILGIDEITFLDVIDGDVDKAHPPEVIAQVAAHIRRIRPQVVLTFDPFGVYGHPDHIAISQLTMAAVVTAAAPTLGSEGESIPHTVSKLYYVAENQPLLDLYEAQMGEIRMTVNGEERRPVGWPFWAASAVIDVGKYWDQVTRAVACHASQQLDPEMFKRMAELAPEPIWARRTYYRVYSLVNDDSAPESDIFSGLRPKREFPSIR
jgi:LmbE family N-acetylglucosaminyl deacetylase